MKTKPLSPLMDFRDYVTLQGSIDQLKSNQDAFVNDRNLFRDAHNEFVRYAKGRMESMQCEMNTMKMHIRWNKRSWWSKFWNPSEKPFGSL